MLTAEFQRNRPNFPIDELRKHVRKWVAFSADGRRILASAETLAALEQNLLAMNEDPKQILFEFVHGPEDDVFIGAEDAGCSFPIKAL